MILDKLLISPFSVNIFRYKVSVFPPIERNQVRNQLPDADYLDFLEVP